jgi:hypothetical protein
MAKRLLMLSGWRRKGRFCLALLMPLLAWSCASEKSQIKALQPAMAKAAYFPAGPDDVSFIDPIARGKKILFFGENPHGVPEINDAVLRLSLHLRKEVGYSVLGYEFPYSGRAILEDQSLGGDAQMPEAIDTKWRLGQDNLPAWLDLVRYNRSAPEDKRLPCTVLDIDAILGCQQLTVLYFQYLASRSSSSEARAEMAKTIPRLVGLKDRKALHAWLGDLERGFRAAWDTFSPADQKEIDYTFELERPSIDDQCLSALGHAFKDQKLRGKCMRKNIERAVARAENSGGSLICYVGAAHALFTPRVHQGGDARYMRQEYPGQVASILVEKVSETHHMTSLVRVYGDFGRTAMEEAALACMGHRDRVFVDLRDEVWKGVKHRPKRFFPKEGPSFDGVLFIK